MDVLQAETRRGLISRIYAELLSSVQDHASFKCRSKWVEDIESIDGDKWDTALESIPVVSVSASQTVTIIYLTQSI